MGWLRDLEEKQYVHEYFKVTWHERDIDEKIHDTVIYVHDTLRDSRVAFKEFADSLYGAGLITHSQYKIEHKGLRFLFKYRYGVLQGDLRGYDKCTTLIINRGGL